MPLVAMNKSSYRKLPADARRIIDKFSGEIFARQFGAFWDRVAISGRKKVESQKNNKIFQIDAAEKIRWQKAIEPATVAWIKKTPGGAKVLATFRAEQDRALAGK